MGRPGWERSLRNLRAWARYASSRHDGAEGYVQLFADRPRNTRVFGEISPDYARLSASQITELHGNLDRPKLFVIMREPVGRALSQLNHEARLHPEIGSTPARQVEFLGSDTVRVMSEYVRIIEALKALPNQHDVGIFFFEDFVEDMPSFFKKFCDFLQVPYVEEMTHELRNPPREGYAFEISSEARDCAVALFAGVTDEVERLVGRVPAKWKAARASGATAAGSLVVGDVSGPA